MPASKTAAAAVPRRVRTPLGLPPGSVRALLTLLIVLVVCTEVLRGNKPDTLWTETLMIALAQYFTSRRFVNLSPEVLRRLEDEGVLPREPQPLWLPRMTIRLLIVAVFGVLAVQMYRWGRLLEGPVAATLGLVGAYLLGVIAGGIARWWTHGRPTRLGRAWSDVKAGAALVLLPITAAAYLFGHPEWLPVAFRDAALGLTLFYFGSR